MTGLVAGGQGADQPATLGFRQRRVGGLADQRVAEQRHVSAAVLHRASWRLEQQNSGHWPLKQPPPRGNPCWERNRPPLAKDANDHGAIVPSRNAAARAATASTADRTGDQQSPAQVDPGRRIGPLFKRAACGGVTAESRSISGAAPL